MSPLKKLILRVFIFAILYTLSFSAFGQSITVFEGEVKETIQRVETFHVRVASLNFSSKPQLAKRKLELYKELATNMSVPVKYAHLKFPNAESTRPWTIKAEKIARGLKPNINYQVARGRNDSVICGTEKAIDNLYNNVRIIAWYHDQLDSNYSSENSDVGALALAGLIDEYLEVLHKALPRVKVRARGRMNVANDNKLKYPEKQLWRILSVINRHFFYKVQVHANRKDFYAADFLLMNSMIRTAALFGARPPNSTLTEIDFSLTEDAPGWRGHAYDAINAWDQEVNEEFEHPQNLCAIKIPSKEKPKPKKPAPPKKAPPKKDAFPPNVEDVKEIGGQIFLKINGSWKPWKPKK